MRHFEIPMNSNLFNTLEYVVFDLVLAIFVYVLTSKLVGLYNCYDALKNHRRSHICEDTRAPLFETGIVCTKKKVFYAIVAIRILSWILIFSTNLLIRGRSKPIIEERTVSVTTLGRFSTFDPHQLLQQRQFLRKTCVNRSEESYYYGEIRNGSCQTDRVLFSPSVEFGFEFKPTFVSTNGCGGKNGSIARHERFNCNDTATTPTANTVPTITCTYNTTNGKISDELCFENGTAPFRPCVRTVPREQSENILFDCGGPANPQELTCALRGVSNITFSLCDNAVIGCLNTLGGLDCSGFVSINGTTHMCEKLEPGDQKNPNATCKRAAGAEWNITDWIPFYGIEGLDTISNVIAVAYGSGSEQRQVKQYSAKERSLTAVNVLWTAALAAKVMMVLALYLTCEYLSRRYGVFVVANDEPRILSLLNATVTRIRRGRTTRTVGRDVKLRVALDNGVVRLQDAEDEVFDA